jgi:hypothetical protein
VGIALASIQSKGQARTWTKTGEPVCWTTTPYSVHAAKITSEQVRTPDARLAEIELLYDRYIVGPAVLDAEASRSASAYGENVDVRGHWRHAHFRMQPHAAA